MCVIGGIKFDNFVKILQTAKLNSMPKFPTIQLGNFSGCFEWSKLSVPRQIFMLVIHLYGFMRNTRLVQNLGLLCYPFGPYPVI